MMHRSTRTTCFLLCRIAYQVGNLPVTNCFKARHGGTVSFSSWPLPASSSAEDPLLSPPPSPGRRLDSSQYLDILGATTALLDVRAPIEFSKGACPNAVNIPLLSDKQRELVGTCYKNEGQAAAIALGYTLVDPETRAALLQAWTAHIARYPEGYLYCFRGGLRSHLVQEWLQDAGIEYPLLIGGYKAVRTSLLADLDVSLQVLPVILVGGRTCSGKTVVLAHLERVVDLEGLAQHRGSAFGGIARPAQPGQIDFENSIILELYQHRQTSATLPVFLEDEGERIGNRSLPFPLNTAMAQEFPLVIVETPIEERIDLCIQEYVEDPYAAFLEEGQQQHNNNNTTVGHSTTEGKTTRTATIEQVAQERIRDDFMGAVGRIQKGLQRRLGGAPRTRHRANELPPEFESAFEVFARSGAARDVSGFRRPIQTLLEDYYDPIYDYQMTQRQGTVLFRGTMDDVIRWATEYRSTKR